MLVRGVEDIHVVLRAGSPAQNRHARRARRAARGPLRRRRRGGRDAAGRRGGRGHALHRLRARRHRRRSPLRRRARPAGQRRDRVSTQRQQRARPRPAHAAARSRDLPGRRPGGLRAPHAHRRPEVLGRHAGAAGRRGLGRAGRDRDRGGGAPAGLRATARGVSPNWWPRRSSTPTPGPSSPPRAAGWSRPATRCAGAWSVRCTKVRSSTSSRSRSSCGSPAARANPGTQEEKVLADALADAMEASAELSELARGLHPAVLSERGLAAALQALAARAADARPAARAARPALRGRGRDDGIRDGRRGGRQRRAARARDGVHAPRRRRAATGSTVEVRDNGIGGATPENGGGLEVHGRSDRGDRRAVRAGVTARRRHRRADRDPR